MSPPIRLLVNGIHAKAGGGRTYLRMMLPHLATHPDLVVDVVVTRAQAAEFADLDPRVTLHLVDPLPTLPGLLLWEQAMLPILARRWGAQATLSPANYGPILAPRPILKMLNALEVGRFERRWSKRPYWFALGIATVICLLACRRVLVPSDYTRRALPLGLGRPLARKIAVVPMGAAPIFRPVAGEGPAAPPFVLAVGDMYVQKNYLNLIAAFAAVARAMPDARLKIAGRPIDADYFARVQEAAARNGLADRVDFLGQRAEHEIAALYRQATVFVFTSTVETFGLPLVEAMASGAAVASSNTTAMPELGDDAVLYFDPNDSGDMARQILALLTDPVRRDELRRKAAERGKLFTWAETARRTAEIVVACVRGETLAASAVGRS
ncbi:MAG: glycosyltransferase family 4 protein [Proteobacteria bacterium]|nr:glycosyltransferase family 4 protein [Pseudomonadota bacterium]